MTVLYDSTYMRDPELSNSFTETAGRKVAPEGE